MHVIPIPHEAQLEAFATRLASAVDPPLVVYLDGPLGAGKTTFVRAFARALGYPGRVKSPTYGLLERYDVAGVFLLHLDLYRLEDPAELDYLALRDLFDAQTLLLIEWPAKGGLSLPAADLELLFSEAVSDRKLTAVAKTTKGEGVLSRIFPGTADQP